MTKQVRIENADTSQQNLIVELWDKNGNETRMIKRLPLNNATDMASVMIHGTQFIVVRERLTEEQQFWDAQYTIN